MIYADDLREKTTMERISSSRLEWSVVRPLPLRCCVRRTSSEKIMEDSYSQASEEIKEENVEHLYNKQRTVVMVRNSLNSSFGFALQRRAGGFTEQLTYVDYVRDESPAARAGIKRGIDSTKRNQVTGDIIISINGFSSIGQSHSSLVTFINSLVRIKLVLLFQNIARIVQLSARSLQLQYIIAEKEMIVKMIELEEQQILAKGHTKPELTDIDFLSCPNIHPDDPSHSDRISFCSVASVKSEYDNPELVTRL